MDPELRSIAAVEYNMPRLAKVEVSAGYGAQMRGHLYPGPSEMNDLLESGVRAAHLWDSVLLVALEVPEISGFTKWEDWIAWMRDNPHARDNAVAKADAQAGQRGVTRLLLFDALDHLHHDRGQADRLVGGLLQLALQIRLRTRNLRFKVFIRPDMFESGGGSFPDASKLSSNAADLTWSTVNLYGLFFHYLGNRGSSEVARRYREFFGGWRNDVDQRYLPPTELLANAAIQKEEFSRIAGPYMGANYRKGHTYTWLPNHLMDGTEQVSPRSFLNALRTAVNETMGHHADHDCALHFEGIRKGVQTASTTRVLEISEDLPWVSTAINPLRGEQVPIEQDVVLRRWQEEGLRDLLERQAERARQRDEETVRTGPRNADSYPELIGELIELGVMRRRKDGRLDLPDVYRIAFSVGRKGGVPKVKAS